MPEAFVHAISAAPGSDPASKGAYDPDIVGSLSNDAVVRHLARRIGEKVGVYYPEMDARAVTVTGKVWGGQETARTFRFEARWQGMTKEQVIFVKLCPVFEHINPSAVEFETLQLLHERMPSIQSNCHVSRPLDFYPELNAYAMESVGTKNFKPYLLRRNSLFSSDGSLAALYSVVSGCADWLRIFHGITRSASKRPFDCRSFVDGINEDYDYRSLRKFHFRKETLAALDALIDELVLLDGAYELPCAAWHWDFTPGHVYLDNGRISVIDVLGAGDSPIFEDIGRFLAAMATINSFPFYPFFDHRRADFVLGEIFLESYAKDTSRDLETFKLFAAIYKLKYLIVWFCGQNYRVSSKIHPLAGRLFANSRLVRLFEPSLLRVVDEIARRLRNHLGNH
jgi:hypothetical protein